MLQTAETLSPFLEITAPGIITAELPGERHFDEEQLMRKCIRPIQSIGLDVRVGAAGTPDLALLAARFAEPVRLVDSAAAFLEPLPVEVLAPSEELFGGASLVGYPHHRSVGRSSHSRSVRAAGAGGGWVMGTSTGRSSASPPAC